MERESFNVIDAFGPQEGLAGCNKIILHNYNSIRLAMSYGAECWWKETRE